MPPRSVLTARRVDSTCILLYNENLPLRHKWTFPLRYNPLKRFCLCERHLPTFRRGIVLSPRDVFDTFHNITIVRERNYKAPICLFHRDFGHMFSSALDDLSIMVYHLWVIVNH